MNGIYLYGSRSGQRIFKQAVMSGMAQESILVTVLFDIFINNLENGMGSSLSKLVADTKLDGEFSMLEGKGLFQTYLNSTDKWADRKLSRFSKAMGSRNG